MDAVVVAAINGVVLIAVAALQLFVARSQEKLRTQVNGRLTELLELTSRAAEARGKLEGPKASPPRSARARPPR